MLLSRLLADFTRGESDALRKAMGKKKKDIVDAMKPKFIEGGVKNGHDPKILDKIWGDWEKFASYAFNKSHAVCYAWVAYQTAYLKAHYTAEYMCAVLSRSGDIKEIAKQMDECRRMGLDVKGPDINMSRERYSVDSEGAVRFGLSKIKSVGEGAAEAIVKERKANGLYKDIFDFVERVDLGSVNRKCIESLVISGAFDSIGGIRREQYLGTDMRGEAFLDQLVKYGQKYRADKESNENSLFGDMGDDAIEIAHPKIPEGEPMSTLERLNKEKEYVGLFLSAHPLDEYKYPLLYACNTTMAELEKIPNPRTAEEKQSVLNKLTKDQITEIERFQAREISCGGLVTAYRSGTSKAGNQYGIVTVEDYSGKHDFALFGEAFPQFSGYCHEGMYLFITAKYQNRRFVRQAQTIFDKEFQILKIQLLSDVADRLLEKLTVVMDMQRCSKAVVDLIAKELRDEVPAEDQAKANTDLYFEFVDESRDLKVNLRARNTKVRVTSPVVDFLMNQDGLQCKINDKLVVAQSIEEVEDSAEDMAEELEED